MAQKTVKTRIRQKHEIAANWEAATGFKPLAGELIVYDAENGQGPRLKIGDENTTVNDLPFVEAVPLAHNHAIADVTGLQSALNEIPTVVNSLTSTSTTSALSAAQGKVLNDKINAINTNLEDLGAGDMLKSVYDTNGNGIVDNAEKVNGFTVGVDVPANAKFTDTIYTLPTAGSSLGGVKSGGDVTITDGVITVNDNSHNHSASEITSGTLSLDRIPSITSAKISSLDASKLTGTVPTSALPSYVDDVIEGTYVSSTSFKNTSGSAITGETGKIYVDTTTNKSYRWSGSAFVEISASLALGTTSSTAYRGDYGNTAYTHSQKTSGNPHGVTKSDVGLGNVENKSSATIRGEITKANVTTALGYTPLDEANIDSVELITVDDIDAICGTVAQIATLSEVAF